MIKRLCFIVPNIKLTKQIVKDLEAVGVKDSHVHVLGKNPEVVKRNNLHQASILQTTHMGSALRRAGLISVAFIVLIFITFKLTMPLGLELSAFALASMITFGFLIGIWIALLIGIGVPSAVVEASQDEISSGHYLMMVDVPADRADDITKKILYGNKGVHLAEPAVETP